MQRRVLMKADKRVKTLASLYLAYCKTKQYFTIPTRVSARLTYSELQSIRDDLCFHSDEFIHYLKSNNGRQIYADDPGFFEFLMDLGRMPPQQLLVIFKTTVLIDSYLKDINEFFYSIFFLFKSFLYSWYTAVVHLSQCSREGQLGYARGLRLVATLIGLFTWELLQVCIRGLQVIAKFIGVFMWELLQYFQIWDLCISFLYSFGIFLTFASYLHVRH